MPNARLETDMGLGPGYGPWTYTSLSESEVLAELRRLADVKMVNGVHCASLQPCPNPEEYSQDRYCVHDWPLPSGTWKFIGMFDGHAGHETVDFAVQELPSTILASLRAFLTEQRASDDSTSIAQILESAIVEFDEGIAQAFYELLPTGQDPVKLRDLTSQEIEVIVNNNRENSSKVLRCMRGSTALIALIDPPHQNIWVASLGDCIAVVGHKDQEGKWGATTLSSDHNGTNPVEAARVRTEHLGEANCIKNNRVLGAIAVTRALGDYVFKIPKEFTEKVFLKSNPGFKIVTKIEDILERHFTPPYVSNRPEIRHFNLELLQEPVLVMCTDGLKDLYLSTGPYAASTPEAVMTPEICLRWIRTVGESKGDNKALALLKDGLGGPDTDQISRMLTVEMTERWMDDTTIAVYELY